MAKKRPTPRDRHAAQARHTQEVAARPPTGRRPLVRILALLAILGIIVSLFASVLLAFL